MRKRDLFTPFLLAFCNLYGLTLTTLLLMRFVIGERPLIQGYSPIGLLNSMFAIALIPSLITLLLCLLLRRPGSAALQLIPFILLCVTYGGNFMPRSLVTADNAQTLSILSYNLYASNTRYDQAEAIIRAANADVVALQELTEAATEYLAAAFETDYPYQVMYPVGQSVSGSGLLSRYPVSDDEVWVDVMQQQQVVIEINDETISVFNVHPPVPMLYGASPGLRSQVIRDILSRASRVEGKMLLVGDFNMGEASEDYDRVITAGYTDSFRVAGYGFGLSFPDWSRLRLPLRLLPPLSRIDYIFYSDGFRAINAWTSHTSDGSDHRPIYAELLLD